MTTVPAVASAGGARGACESLEQVITLVDAGELDASPAERAYLAGVIQALRSLETLDAVL